MKITRIGGRGEPKTSRITGLGRSYSCCSRRAAFGVEDWPQQRTMASQAAANEIKSGCTRYDYSAKHGGFPYMATGGPNLAGGRPKAMCGRQAVSSCGRGLLQRQKYTTRRSCLELKMLGYRAAAKRMTGRQVRRNHAVSECASSCENHRIVDALVCRLLTLFV